jgi:ATP/maltotriose-dependent transcriptional regulator MalT
VTESAILFLLRGLVEKSLVLAGEHGGETRYHMLETLRQHGAEKLHEAGEDTLLRARHLHWFLDLAERGKLGHRGPEEEWWRLRLQREMDNCRSALVWSHAEQDQQDTALGLAASLARFWWLNGFAGEGAAWIDRLLAGAPPNLTRAKALAAAAWLALRRGDPAARQLAEAALSLARELGDQRLIVTILHYLGDARFVDGDSAGARAALEEGLTLAEAMHWPYGIYPILRILGQVMAALGLQGEAVDCLRHAVALAREQQDLHMVSLIESVQGAVLLDMGDVAAARENLAEGLALGPDRSAAQAAQKLALLAGLEVAEGDMTRAFTLAGAATSLITIAQGQFPHWSLARLERDLKPAYETLNPIARATAWARGAAMCLDEAVSYALRRDVPTPMRPPLTEREREVAILLSQGLSNRDLATQLVISENTAKRHVEKILAKLGLHSRAKIASWAIQSGLVGTGPVQDRAR